MFGTRKVNVELRGVNSTTLIFMFSCLLYFAYVANQQIVAVFILVMKISNDSAMN